MKFFNRKYNHTKYLLTLLFFSSFLTHTYAQFEWTTSGTSIRNLNSGNVGIGSTSPRYKLHIKGNDELLLLEDLTSHPHIGFEGIYPLGEMGFIHGTDFEIKTFGDANISLKTPAHILLNPNNYGLNVGIGTSSPAFTLDIHNPNDYVNQRVYSANEEGKAHLLVGASNGGHINLVANSTNSTFLGVDPGLSGLVTDWSDMIFSTGTLGAASEKFRITRDGFTGIGTKNPLSLVSLRQVSASHKILSINRPDSDIAALYLGNDAEHNGILAANNKDILFGRDFNGTFSEYMRVENNSGFVGIGTDQPVTNLDIVGDDPAISIRSKSYPPMNLLFGIEEGSNTTYIKSSEIAAENNEVPLRIIASSTEFSSGQVSIGTDFSGISTINLDRFNLYVSKGVLSEDFGVGPQNTWADYVFNEDYSLPTLEVVDEHISKHKHLPGIPAASEIALDGYTMHDMTVRLLTKVEELTLYTIEQEKEINRQEEALALQEKKIIALESKLASILKKLDK